MLDDTDEFASPDDAKMSKDEFIEYLRHQLEEHKGTDRVFAHCDKEWWVDMLIMPVILCPECGQGMAAVSVKCSTCLCHPCVCGLTTW